MKQVILLVFGFMCYVGCEEGEVEQVLDRYKRKTFETDKYLEQFGYLDDKQKDIQHSEDSRRQAISEFQQMAGLRVTGELNTATVRKMKSPRCGLPDVIKPRDRIAPDVGNSRDLKRNQPLQFNAPGYKWDKSQITYKFTGYTRKLSEGDIRRSIKNALTKWEEVSPLRFTELSRTSRADADILINFVRYDHGDGSTFDGRGGTLAHAFFPGKSALAGDTHFDDDENWTVRSEDGTNLEIVAAHEFGHALGLGHSNVRGALMQPFYSGYDPDYALHNDDQRGMQSLYRGMRPPVVTTRPPPRTTRRPPPRTTQRRRQTVKPGPTAKPSDVCEVRVDDIANGPDGHLYAFRARNTYKFNSNGVGIERGFPKKTRKVFQKGPNYIGAAVYDKWRRKFYMFKGRKYWRYTGFNLDPGYPKRLKGWYAGLQAALQEDNGEIRVLKGSQMSVWREDFITPPRGYPVDIKVRWPGLRSTLEGAVRYQRVSYFFKGLNYFKWDDYRRKVAYKKTKAGPWMGCGRIEPK